MMNPRGLYIGAVRVILIGPLLLSLNASFWDFRRT